PISQPLYHGTADEYTAFQGVLNFVADLAGSGRHQVVLRQDRLIADIHKHEASGTLRIFYHAYFSTHLSEESSLLVTRNTGNRYFGGQYIACRFPVYFARRFYLRKQAFRNIKKVQQLLVPV